MTFKHYLGLITAAILACTAFVALPERANTTTVIVKTDKFPQPRPAAGPAVFVRTDKGHGSGVHIGDGYILTAAHVVKAANLVIVKADDLSVRGAEVYWLNEAYDVALLRIGHSHQIRPAFLDCRDTAIGESVSAAGNPLNVEFVATYGKVAGKPREEHPWKEVTPLSVNVAPGQSGGPVLDDSGHVVGLTVGVQLAPLGGLQMSLTGVAFMVPSPVVCKLLGRG